MKKLETLVKQFNTMIFPEQRMQMITGTSYLVNALWAQVWCQQEFISAFDDWATGSAEGIGGTKFDAMLKAREELLKAQERGE